MLVSSSHSERVPGPRTFGPLTPAALALALATAIAWLALAAPAGARSFSFGIGDVPDLAIDRAGTAHLVWAGDSGVLYCGIPRGAEACGKPRALYGRGLSAGRPHMLPAGRGRLVVSLGDGPCPEPRPDLGYCTYVRSSANDGVSFGPPQAIAAPEGPEPLAGPNSFGDAVYGPGDSVSYASATSAVFFANAPLSGAIEHRFARLAAPLPGATGAVLGLAGSTPVVAFADTGEPQTLYWQAYRGPAGLDEAAGWTPPQPIESGVQVLENDSIAAGPAGLFVMYQSGPARGPQRLFVRRFAGGGFGPATPIGEPLHPARGDPVPADLAEDAAGRLHAVWIDYRTNRLRAAASTAGGAIWGKPLTIAAGKAIASIEQRLFPRLAAAAGPEGIGYAVWTAGASGRRGEGFDLRAALLEPVVPRDACRLPNCLALGGKAAGASGGGKLDLRTQIVSCAPKRLKLKARIGIAPGRGSKAEPQLRRAVLRLDGGRPREARGRPPAASFALTRTEPAGRHRLVAKLTLGGRGSRELTLSQTFAACP
jgi:hypothetical protein